VHLVAQPLRRLDDGGGEHPTRSGDEEAHHRIPISELSPTMKR
jgi:hypothetical protein